MTFAPQDQIVHLQKREQKLTREVATLTKRIARAEHRLNQVIEGVRRGLPHMNLKEYLIEEENIDG